MRLFFVVFLLVRATALVAPPIQNEPWIRCRIVDERAVVLETCSRSYECTSATSELSGMRVELVGVVHYGSPEYFDELVSRQKTLYESLVDDWMVDSKQRLSTPVAATRSARRLAASSGLVAQSDALGRVAYEEGWTIADRPAEEMVTRRRSPSPPLNFGAVAARAACVLAPCPELALAVVDWSFSSPRDSVAVVDEMALSVASAGIADLDPAVLSRLALLRSLAPGSRRQGAESDPIVVERNDEVIRWIRRVGLVGDSPPSLRVVYGAMHMRDLERKLRGLGFQQDDEPLWRTAFGVPLVSSSKSIFGGGREGSVFPAAFGLVGSLLLYLVLDAADYVYFILDAVAEANDQPSLPFVNAVLYFTRHAALYYALNKFLVS